MILSRNIFFFFLLIMVLLPFVGYKLVWLSTTTETTGYMDFTGHGNLGSVFGISTYPVIRFTLGPHKIYFNGNVNIPLAPNEPVSVRYQSNDPEDAKINTFSCIWGDTLAYALAPLLILLVVFFHPEVVPKKSTICIGKKPLLQIISAE